MAKSTNGDVRETEEELIGTAQEAVSRSNWVVGECAFKWTRKYAKGRTDADFGVLVGLSGDQIYQRRRVWETFSDVRENYRALKWSHFYLALTWDDAAECLAWAEENEATVAEMRTWRRAQRGEDLTAPSDEDQWDDPNIVQFVPSEPTLVRDPSTFGSGESSGSPRGSSSGQNRGELVSTVARGASGDGDDYAPFRRDAGSPAPKADSGDVVVAEKPQPSPQQILKRATTSIERLNQTLTPAMLKQIGKLPDKQRTRLVKAVGELASKVSQLG